MHLIFFLSIMRCTHRITPERGHSRIFLIRAKYPPVLKHSKTLSTFGFILNENALFKTNYLRCKVSSVTIISIGVHIFFHSGYAVGLLARNVSIHKSSIRTRDLLPVSVLVIL